MTKNTSNARRIKALEADLADLRATREKAIAAREKAHKHVSQIEAYASAVTELASSAERLIEAGLVESAQMLLKMNRMIQIEYLRGKVSREPGGIYYEEAISSDEAICGAGARPGAICEAGARPEERG